MESTGEKDQYRAVIPAEEIPPTWDLMYFIEAMDKAGNGQIHPGLNRETPYIAFIRSFVSDAAFVTSPAGTVRTSASMLRVPARRNSFWPRAARGSRQHRRWWRWTRPETGRASCRE